MFIEKMKATQNWLFSFFRDWSKVTQGTPNKRSKTKTPITLTEKKKKERKKATKKLIHVWWDAKTVHLFWKKSLSVFIKVNMTQQFTPMYLHKRNKSTCSQKDLYMNIHGRFIQSPKQKTAPGIHQQMKR